MPVIPAFGTQWPEDLEFEASFGVGNVEEEGKREGEKEDRRKGKEGWREGRKE